MLHMKLNWGKISWHPTSHGMHNTKMKISEIQGGGFISPLLSFLGESHFILRKFTSRYTTKSIHQASYYTSLYCLLLFTVHVLSVGISMILLYKNKRHLQYDTATIWQGLHFILKNLQNMDDFCFFNKRPRLWNHASTMRQKTRCTFHYELNSADRAKKIVDTSPKIQMTSCSDKLKKNNHVWRG